jgi:hypothetical protein
VYVLALHFCLASAAISQQNPSSTSTSTQALSALQNAYSALVGRTGVADVTLTGTVERIVGPDDETGTVVLKATATGESRMDLSLSSGDRSEIRSFDSANSPVGAWSGSDGVQHAIPYHNLLSDSAWFFPALTLRRLFNTTGIVGTYVGQETLDGQSVVHVYFSQAPAVANTKNAGVLQHLTQMDFYLDPTTLLPVALSYATHPDDNELLDIPVQVQFSNYRNIDGVQIPFHVQKFLNGNLSLDLQIQSAAVNSGLSASAFGVQIGQ